MTRALTEEEKSARRDQKQRDLDELAGRGVHAKDRKNARRAVARLAKKDAADAGARTS
ncbi:hypothetical protein GCM10011611_26310 [Aliidongia dinghuensis]|uniref:Uncharacterized protein n=1 Tax=Aliidongia dinghuensis TaxID=1867774 RepID=A0A8J2YUU7_9PROT|nr:hypothetical protein [Aliidongia dinghuensis]GGF19154.1 hypothetical protein GCM10011611_26310 [Aliidongia dinghuensis]